ncbi:hypothetical protein C8R46DRAFT_914704 [Mycena filopes]|nr:hypothetical protein C8R46DRAFT_914704 [Mycena filopes]
MSQQADGLWFSTDSLVTLRAEETVFRVPQSILAARSRVFEAMFQFPQPSSADPSAVNDEQEILDGAPVVRLFDSAAEVEPFLRAIFDSSYFMPPPATVELSDVLAILRLSHKYDVGYLYKRALVHLETLYICDVNKLFDTRTAKSWSPTPGVAVHLKLLPILYEVGATWALPYVYYCIAVRMLSELREAGAPWTQLSSEWQQACIGAQVEQVRGMVQINRFLVPLSTCKTAATCDAAKRA